MVEIDILLKNKKVNIGYRQCCGKKDNSEINFKNFEKQIKEMEKDNIFVIKKQFKVDNAYATSKGGFWQEFEYSIIDNNFLTPNVKMIIKEKYRLIKNKIPRQVRTELNNAVKNGILGHIKKDGLCDECYYFVSFKKEAENAIYNKASESIELISKILFKED